MHGEEAIPGSTVRPIPMSPRIPRHEAQHHDISLFPVSSVNLYLALPPEVTKRAVDTTPDEVVPDDGRTRAEHAQKSLLTNILTFTSMIV